jgi:hypothetical protein
MSVTTENSYYISDKAKAKVQQLDEGCWYQR